MKKETKKSASYQDIINLPRPSSSAYPPMPREKRAAQFSPFAALSGHEEAVQEKARLTERKIELSDNKKALLNRRLLLLQKHIGQKPTVTITYFIPDPKKPGGRYVTKTGVATKLVEHEGTITVGGQLIPLKDVVFLEGKLFDPAGIGW